MPEEPNWDIIRELYNKGLPLRKIAEQFGLQVGTIASRASRGNWKRVAAKAKEIAQSVSVTIQGKAEETPESNQLAKASTAVRSKLSDALLEATGCLDTLPQSKSLKSRSANAALLSTLAGVSKTVFGWSEGQQQPSVRIQVMSGLVSIAEQVQPPDPRPVIECESVKQVQDSTSGASDTKPQ